MRTSPTDAQPALSACDCGRVHIADWCKNHLVIMAGEGFEGKGMLCWNCLWLFSNYQIAPVIRLMQCEHSAKAASLAAKKAGYATGSIRHEQVIEGDAGLRGSHEVTQIDHLFPQRHNELPECQWVPHRTIPGALPVAVA